MERYKNGVICTKIRFWKQKDIILNVINHLLQKGYSFKELVYGEPNDFVFADQYDDILPTLQRKGNYFGIRIKMNLHDSMIEISCNTNGIDNVKYDIYADSEETLQSINNDLLSLKDIIKPSNSGMSVINEYLSNNPSIVKIMIAILAVIVLYFLGVHVLLWNVVRIVFSISPFLVLFIIYLILSRRKR